ncbi:MAG: radical SAM protein [Bacilli bacterium]
MLYLMMKEDNVMFEELNCCKLCPRNCKVNRNNNEVGYCKATNQVKVGRAALHLWEEPCLSGQEGSGTVFFSYCNLGCIYCQNSEISTENKGKVVTIERLADIYLELQNQGANNINLVTPTHYIPQIKQSLIIAKSKGLTIPIVYNTSSYENVEALKLLEGLIDIYLPDLKYTRDDLAINYSHAPNYFSFANSAIEEMYRQVGTPIFNKNGIMLKGVIVRHLILPGEINDSKKVIKYLYDTYQDNIFISIMNQYTVVKKLEYPNLNRSVTDIEYQSIIDYALDIGIKNGFIQEGETDKSSFIPSFNGEGV